MYLKYKIHFETKSKYKLHAMYLKHVFQIHVFHLFHNPGGKDIVARNCAIKCDAM